jgi:hypothetical protein
MADEGVGAGDDLERAPLLSDHAGSSSTGGQQTDAESYDVNPATGTTPQASQEEKDAALARRMGIIESEARARNGQSAGTAGRRTIPIPPDQQTYYYGNKNKTLSHSTALERQISLFNLPVNRCCNLRYLFVTYPCTVVEHAIL